MTSDILSAVILIVFALLLLVGATTTTARVIRYRRADLPQPRLLGRDRDLLIGLAIPFLIVAAVRVIPELQQIVRDGSDTPHWWYLLLTGLPPIYALAKYDFYELRVIERVDPTRDVQERTAAALERTADATERIADEK